MCKIYQSDVSAAASLYTITTLGLRRLPMIFNRTLNAKIPERAGQMAESDQDSSDECHPDRRC
jgi:hypothetical protein